MKVTPVIRLFKEIFDQIDKELNNSKTNWLTYLKCYILIFFFKGIIFTLILYPITIIICSLKFFVLAMISWVITPAI